MDVSGLRCEDTCPTGFQPVKMFHAYSHINMRCRRLTMLNPMLQPGGRHTPKLVPSRGTTWTSASTITAPNLSPCHKISHFYPKFPCVLWLKIGCGRYSAFSTQHSALNIQHSAPSPLNLAHRPLNCFTLGKQPAGSRLPGGIFSSHSAQKLRRGH